jgi:hypothetical protein
MSDPYLASNEFPGDGVTTLFNISFKGNRPDAGSGVVPYLNSADVKAQVITPATPSAPATAVDVPCVFVGPNQFSVTPATPIGKITRIYRATQEEYALVDYQSLQTVGEADLDLSNRQTVFIVQETQDLATRANIVAAQTTQVAYDAAQAAEDAAEVAAEAAVAAQNAAIQAAATAASTTAALERAVRVPNGDAAIPSLPSAASRANKVLGFDAAGNPLGILPATGSGTELAIDLANPTDPSKGAGMLGRASVSIASVVDLLAAKQDASALYCLAAYYPGVYALASPSAGLGSNQFKWAPLVPRTSHNGGTIISPTVPWAGTQASLAAFLLKTGETQPAGVGCFVAINRQQINVGQFGATGVSTDDQTQSLLSAIVAAPAGGELIFPLGIFTTTQTLTITKSLNIYGLGAAVNVSLRCTTASFIPTLKIDGPDEGSIRNLGFWSSLNNGPQLHITNTAHMWHLDTLLFRSCPGTALKVDSTSWDFHWLNIDILSCASDTTLAPVDGAALVVGGTTGDVNNAHFTHLRIEQAKNASIYWTGSGTITKGKCDRGFIAGVTQPSVIIECLGRGQVTFTDYYIGGSTAQYEVKHISGVLKFVACILDRPTTLDGIVLLSLTRLHSKVDAIAYSFFEPRTGRISFTACTLKGAHVSVSGLVRGVVAGIAAVNVYIANDVVATSAFNGGGNYTEVTLTTNSTYPSNNYLDRAFLVNAATGAKAKITTSFSTGQMRLATNRVAEFPVASTARIEYFANDEEFASFRGCTFENVQPFDIKANALAISAPTYSGATFLTSATLSGAVTTGYAGLFLVNQTTGMRWKILTHTGSVITMHYDVSAQLGTGDAYSVMAIGGYSVNTDGVTANWMYANVVKTKAVSELAKVSRTISDVIFATD